MLGVDARTARVLWTALLFAVGLTALWLLRHALLLLAIAVVFAYLVAPLVRLAQRPAPLRRHRGLAILLVYLVLLGALTAVGFAVGPRLAADTTALARRVPEMSAEVRSGQLLGSLLARWGIDPSHGAEVDAFLRSHAGEVVQYAQRAAAALLGWASRAWLYVLVPIFAFFFLKDRARLAAAIEGMLERRGDRRLWRDVIHDVDALLGEYVRALIVQCALTFVVWAALFLLTGVPFAVLLAVLGGTLEFIPVVGPAVAGVVVMAVALFAGFAHPFLLLGFLVAWRLVQDYVTSPLVMGSGVELHPALIVFGVIAGGEIGGVAGMFLSIPVMAGVRIVWRHLRARDRVAEAAVPDPGPGTSGSARRPPVR